MSMILTAIELVYIAAAPIGVTIHAIHLFHKLMH